MSFSISEFWVLYSGILPSQTAAMLEVTNTLGNTEDVQSLSQPLENVSTENTQSDFCFNDYNCDYQFLVQS